MAAPLLAALAACLLHGGAATLGDNGLRPAGSEAAATRSAHSATSPWTWRCSGAPDHICRRHVLEDKEVPSSAATCKLTCGSDANLWPRPQHVTIHERQTRAINFNAMNIEFMVANGTSVDSQRMAGGLLEKMTDRFRDLQEAKATNDDGGVTVKDGENIEVRTCVKDPGVARLTLDTDESYQLSVLKEADSVVVNIAADNVFGVRHGLETLNQLIVKDDLRRQLVLPGRLDIRDAPAYKYRGVLLDTARSYVTVAAIKRTLDAMAASKLNTFHWHITDSQSFPFVSKSFPGLSRFGAFSPQEVYTPDDIADVVEYARVRGVRVLPEFDAPAHVGEGWQTVGDGSVVCFRKEPWQKFCVEPPCGQLDPTVDRVYDVLAGIYRDMLDAFRPDMFHMGGDEVNFNCWNTTESIVQWMSQRNGSARRADDFRMVWDHFQSRALRELVKANKGQELPVVLWTSGLTAPGKVDRYLDPNKYIIQIWTKGDDALIRELSEKKYRLIFSNYDALYLDCGFGAWVGEGNNWCSPYVGWQKVYDNDPRALLRRQGVTEPALLANVLGAEATLWTEQADSSSVDGRLWPRAAAMAERLWTARDSWSWRDAEHRLLDQRNRLVELGVQADRAAPQWCDQNPGLCYLSKRPEDQPEAHADH